MENMLPYAAAAVAAFCFCLALTPLFMGVARRLDFMDHLGNCIAWGQ